MLNTRLLGAAAQWTARWAGEPVNAAAVASTPGRDRMRDHFKFFSESTPVPADSPVPVSPSVVSTARVKTVADVKDRLSTFG